MFPCSVAASALDAMFTVSPQTSKLYFLEPIIPATNGPMCKPIRISQKSRPIAMATSLSVRMKSRISIAAKHARVAGIGSSSVTPESAI